MWYTTMLDSSKPVTAFQQCVAVATAASAANYHSLLFAIELKHI